MEADVAIVGAGFSAIAVAVHLLRTLPPEASIAVISDDPGFGRGTAYRTEFHLHRLNVPAGRMSLFADEPDHFLDWLTRQGRAVKAGDFAARGDYGLYLRDTLASLLRSRGQRARLDFVKAKAVDCITCASGGPTFALDTGERLQARAVALCLGLGNAGLPLPPGRCSTAAMPRIIANPWRLGWLSQIGREDEICILGSGLTMVDQVLTLKAKGHRGRIHVLSRRGLVPHPHAADPVPPVEPALLEGSLTLSRLLAGLRAQVRAGVEWRAVMDGLRPQTQALWQRLPEAERARFLRHALAWWNIHRHRIAPSVHRRFAALMEDGTVTVHAGFLRVIEPAHEGVTLRFRPRGGQGEMRLPADWVINCTGMERAGLGHSPLLSDMAARTMISLDPLGLGLVVDDRSQVLDGAGQPQPGLFAVGALTAGRFWEITAVPDIRVQAKAVADAMAGIAAAWRTMP
ncbi:FAD/NAD(P)-binding protein [Rhizobium sp. CC-YZS058]|uniref:FAD/NAD(P)-binding protein n=1 Tax=Rhizobium sp. CC-YZS058 TaxID=3042153 RepID=UPI002B053EC0|nr:FAD/NAD(P)-binding protein [Rhizobium sp. CC-YZS058]MEA3533181.1 FAD/NAD(P)-binding protein [Rhizobium sp. CC-YZS058]